MSTGDSFRKNYNRGSYAIHIVEAAYPLLQRSARSQPTICPSSVYSLQGDPPRSEQPPALSTSSAFPWPLPCFQPPHRAPHPRAACKTHIKAVTVTGNSVLTKQYAQRRVRKPPVKRDTAAHWPILQKPKKTERPTGRTQLPHHTDQPKTL